MNLEKVVFGFFIILAMTLNFGFVYGDLENPAHHHVYELFFAVIVNLIATVLKFGERTQIGAIHLASSLVADLGLLAASWVWVSAVYIQGTGLTPDATASIVSLSAGALAANILSVIMLLVETVMFRR
jgi:Ca2+/H+ antiporter, TMEM165/GDT1 family